jgi:hypothetical protein
LLQVLALLRILAWLISTSDTDGSDHGKLLTLDHDR